MIWAELSIPKQKSLYAHSYRLPNNDPHKNLVQSLQKLYQTKPNHIRVLLAGDFNFPSNSWSDMGIPSVLHLYVYGYKVNQLFLDAINDAGLEQLVNKLT